MKLIAFVAIVILVLFLGGGAAFLALFSQSPEQDAIVEQQKPDLDPDDFVKLALKPFTVPLTSLKYTVVGVELTFADESAAEFAESRLPRLRSVILEELYEAADKGGKAAGVRDFEALS
jgi:flagellar basal body-associated protein FliL